MVREFTQAESIELMRRLARDVTEAEADHVAEAVGDLRWGSSRPGR